MTRGETTTEEAAITAARRIRHKPDGEQPFAFVGGTGMAETGFVRLEALAGELGSHPATVRRTLRQAGRPLFSDPGDRRRRLIAEQDAAWLKQPAPVGKEAA